MRSSALHNAVLVTGTFNKANLARSERPSGNVAADCVASGRSLIGQNAFCHSCSGAVLLSGSILPRRRLFGGLFVKDVRGGETATGSGFLSPEVSLRVSNQPKPLPNERLLLFWRNMASSAGSGGAAVVCSHKHRGGAENKDAKRDRRAP